MYIIFLSLISILICYKLGDWKNWEKYYSTILFFILSSVTCVILTYNHPLWMTYQSTSAALVLFDLFKSNVINKEAQNILSTYVIDAQDIKNKIINVFNEEEAVISNGV